MKNRRPQNANMRNRPQSFVQLMVGYSRTHWSTPLSPWPTHRRLAEAGNGRPRALHWTTIIVLLQDTPTRGTCLERMALFSCKFSPGTVSDQINDLTFLLIRHFNVKPCTLYWTTIIVLPQDTLTLPSVGTCLHSLGLSVRSHYSDTFFKAHSTRTIIVLLHDTLCCWR